MNSMKMSNIISLDAMKTMSLDQIIQLYNLGYRLEDTSLYKFKSLNNTSISFQVTSCSPPDCKDVHIIINNIDRGITNSSGYLIVDGFVPGSKINFIATKLGSKDYNGEASTGETKTISLETASDFSGTLKFVVSEPGTTTTQLPSYGSHIILDDQEFGITNKFGILLVDKLAVNTTIPFLVNKPGFPESFGIVKVGTGITEVKVNLQLFPTRALAIMRTALIGAIFLTSVGIIGNYLVTHFLEKPISYD